MPRKPPVPDAEPPEAAAFRRAIVADRGDDLPRLVFADWLDEQGDSARAEFIRAQIEQENTVWMTARWRKLDRVARKLRLAHQAEWGSRLNRVASRKYFGRGFVRRVLMHSKRFVEVGGRVLDAEPVEAVQFFTLAGERGTVPLADLLQAPAASRLWGMDFSSAPTWQQEVEALRLYGGRYLPGLRRVTLALANDFDGGSVAEAGAALPSLETLFLRIAPSFDPPTYAASLSGTRRAWAELLSHPAFARIRRLDMQDCGLDDVLPALADRPRSDHLRRLDLDSDWPRRDHSMAIIGEWMRQLAGAQVLAGLTHLSLAGRGVDSGQAATLAKSETLARLEVLDLSDNPVTEADVKRLAGAAFAPTLKVLVARRSRVPRNAAKRLGKLFPGGEVVV